MRRHGDPVYRRKHPSLHYHIWDSANDIKSTFVTLAKYDVPQTEEGQLIMNLAEMWMSLVFQTLRTFHLDEFLPNGVESLWSGTHLNVALPLWQGFKDQATREAILDRHDFKQFLHSPDPHIRAWAEDTRDAYNDLRNSPDPRLREYYKSNYLKALEKARDVIDLYKAENAKAHLEGVLTKVNVSENHYQFAHVWCGNYKFTISAKLGLGLSDGDQVTLQYHLTDTQHPYAYALEALPADPANRLGISIRGHNSDGPFHCWLMADGLLNVKKMNSLVDCLEGYSLEETKRFSRRWYTTKGGEGSRVRYT